ncbi:MAG: hypothetical protein KDA68_07140 [Planctomycetaceae bacterium]|nr:hypothetical protein [Planctomycetaceae bacterium]
MTEPREDPILISSRREAILVAGLWIAAMIYSVLFSWHFGYPDSLEAVKAEDITFVWGVPFWVFWGVFVPWIACSIISILIGLLCMKDEPLGEDVGDDESDLLN